MPEISRCLSLTNFSCSWCSLDLNLVFNALEGKNTISTLGVVDVGSSNPCYDLQHVGNIKDTQVVELNFGTSKIKTLNANCTGSDTGESIPNVTKIIFTGNKYLTDLYNFENFTGILNLNLDKTKISNLTCISSNITLKNLYLNNTLVSSIKPLKNLVNLEKLQIDNSSVSNLNGVQYLSGLKELKIKNNSITDLYYLDKLMENMEGKTWNLKNLDLSDNSLQDSLPIIVEQEKVSDNGEIIVENVNISSFDNVDVLKRLAAKGCNIDVRGNNFNKETVDELDAISRITAK